MGTVRRRSTTGKLMWPCTAEESARMRGFQRENIAISKRNPNENWMAVHLATTGLKWTRQAMWGMRIFDFWCAAKGLAVEVDGPEHRASWDAYRDAQNYKVSGIVVLRVRNRNEEDAAKALAFIATAGSWNKRRRSLGLISAGSSYADHYDPPPVVPIPPVLAPPPAAPKVTPRSPAPWRTKPLGPPQPRCPTCKQRVRMRRPDMTIRCKCGATTGADVARVQQIA